MSTETIAWDTVTRVQFPETGNRWWHVRARQGAFVVCTQQVPFEKRGTLRYTVLDLTRGIRGPANQIGQGWGDGTFSDRQCRFLARSMSFGLVEVSHRNNVPITPVAVEFANERIAS